MLQRQRYKKGKKLQNVTERFPFIFVRIPTVPYGIYMLSDIKTYLFLLMDAIR